MQKASWVFDLDDQWADNPHFFKYDFSPIMVWKQQTKKSFMQFLTSLCAIVGGVFSVAGIANALLHKSVDVIRKLD